MDQPIISPWLIYVLGLVHPLLGVIGVIAALSGTLCIISSLHYIDSSDDHDRKPNDEYLAKRAARARSLFKNFMAICVISTLLLIFIPGKSTIIQMLVAQQVTPNNLKSAGTTIEQGIDKTADKIIEIITKFESRNEKTRN